MDAVTIRGMTKVYQGSTRALDGIDLRVRSGRVFAILGPNGAGKTTLMRILTTQIPATSGEAHVFGRNVATESAEVRKLLGYVPQEMSVWTDITGEENMRIYARIYGIPGSKRPELISDLLERMGIEKFANKEVNVYSGGMIRRLEMACALLVRPKILFLDEPTIGLDPTARKSVWAQLMAFKRESGATVFFSTHYMDEADQHSDEIVIVDRGRIVKEGSARSLKGSLGTERIELEFATAAAAEKAILRLRRLPFVHEASRSNFTVRLMVADAESRLPRVIGLLGGAVKRVSVSKPTLDDVFAKYAGQSGERGGNISELRNTRVMIGRG